MLLKFPPHDKCQREEFEAFKAKASLPLSRTFIPLPKPRDLINGGTIVASEELAELRSIHQEIKDLINDMEVPALLKPEEIQGLEKPNFPISAN